MRIDNFLLRHGYKQKLKLDKENQRMEIILSPRKNLWFYLFCFIETIKYISSLDITFEEEDK